VDTPPAVLGIDLGTSQVKALLCARDGTVLGRGAAGYQVQLPRSGWAEADPEQWWRAVRTAVREALGPAPAEVTGDPARAEVTGGPARAEVTGGPARAEVTGLAAVGQMHGLILLSERSGVLRPPIIWLDRRADAEVADYQRLPADLRARLGNAPSAGMAGPHSALRWIRSSARPLWLRRPCVRCPMP